MAFSSFSFLCIFFPAVFLLYQLIPTSCRTGRAAERTDSMKYRNLFLVFASLLFYSAGEGAHIVLLFLCIAISYAGGLLIGKASEKGLERTKKTVFIVSVAASLGLLAAYKYTGMAIETVNSLFRLSLRSPKQVFPIGISFYTLQSVSYLTDVYRKKSAAEKNAVDLILYLSFFPALLAGPINQYHVISEQISARTADRKTCAEGLERFILGLAKKVLIADTLASGADAVFSMSASSLGMLSAWIGAAAYTLQLYFDFSGYSDMAIGMGSVFGFRFAENFNDPLAAVSIQDFWRRWHMSLTGWLREYLYFPLGGNRKGKFRTVLNRMIVFFFTGLWHGASWTFVLWGLYHGLLSVFETLFPGRNRLPGWLQHLLTLFLVCCGFVLFRSSSMAQAGSMFTAMFTGIRMTKEMQASACALMDRRFLCALAAAILFSFPLEKRIRTWMADRKNGGEQRYENLMRCGSVIVLILCMLTAAGSSYRPFIYFRF